MKRVFALVLAVVMILCLTACGEKTPENSPYAGKWVIDGVISQGLETGYESEIPNDYIQLNNNGKGYLVFMDEGWDITWKETDAGITVEVTGEKMNAVLKEDGMLYMDTDGTTTVRYAKPSATAALGVLPETEKEEVPEASSQIDPPAEEPEQTEQPAEQTPAIPARREGIPGWWNGDWYGYWYIDNGFDDYDQYDGCRQSDVMALIELDESGSGEIFAWDDADEIVCDVDLTASALSGKGSMGAAMSESGYFLYDDEDGALEHADWIIDPGLYEDEIPDMIIIDGEYEDDFGSFTYYIILRPWGVLWDDIDLPEELPDYYDWYEALVKADIPMPDCIGEEVVLGEGSVAETAAPAAVSGADGKAASEDLFYTYQWLRTIPFEFKSYMFYEDVAEYLGTDGAFNPELSEEGKDVYCWYGEGNEILTVSFTDKGIKSTAISGAPSDKWEDLNPFDRLPVPELSKSFGLSSGGFTLSGRMPSEDWLPYDRGFGLSLFWTPCVEAIGSSTPSIAFNVYDSAEKHDNSLSLAEDLTPEGTDNIGGMEMQVQKYELYGMDYLEYYCEKDGKIISVCFKDIDPFTNYAAGAILSSLSFQ